MQSRPAHEIAAGSFVYATIAGRRTLCLKAEREGKEYVNHFVVPLDPPQARLVYVDPNDQMTPVDGISLSFQDGPENVAPGLGDVFLNAAGTMMKLQDDPRSQRMHCYVDLATGHVRPRMERHIRRLLSWSVVRM
jgi:hypothetical protein